MSKKTIPQGSSKGLKGATIYRRGESIAISVNDKLVPAKDHAQYIPKGMSL